MATFSGSAVADILSGSGLADVLIGLGGHDTLDGAGGNDDISGGDGNDLITGGAGNDTIAGGKGVDDIDGSDGADKIDGNNGADIIDGGAGNDSLSGQAGHDLISGGDGDDKITGGTGNDSLNGDAGDDRINGNGGADVIEGGAGADSLYGDGGDDALYGGDGGDKLYGGNNNDTLEGGAGNDVLQGGNGDDLLLAFSWAGEPVPDQDANALVNADEPVEDNDLLIGGDGADTFEFRLLIDAKDEIIAKHTDANGDIDYSMNGVAGENDNVHDHWVESIGLKTVTDYNAAQDSLVFEGHTVRLDTASYEDVNGDGRTDTVLDFVSKQANGGAHDGDKVGTVILLGVQVDAGDINVDAGVFYGVEEPWSVAG
ncbi:MAG: hypothetical protein OIF40_13850 [Mangrovicoccus sp.]|nr:hypothetical protein [Mangrovicoccus sp.]